MNLIKKQKRGLSPLIATILLIAFAVALGAFVMSWGKTADITNEFESTQKCAETSLKVGIINNMPQIYYGGEGNNGFVEFTIENDGNQEIKGLIVWVVGERETMISEIEKLQIKVGYPLTKKLSYNFNKYGEIKKVNFIPKITINEEMITCAKKSVEEERITKLD
ncbi:MAG: hypothetical protein PHV16_05360 [Candidatus Nanoarchaeia archaeon]|nr:hypothetical protein [Candidatus Nanoarchaeia archaeon]